MDSRTKPNWPTFLDGAFDGLVVAFAGWTVFYQFALAYQFSMHWAGWPWILLALCLAVLGGLYACRRAQRDADATAEAEALEVQDTTDGHRQSPPPRQVDAKILAAGIVLLAVLIAQREDWGIWPIGVTGIALLLAQLLPWLTQRTPRQAQTPRRQAPVSQGAHVFALVASLGFGVVGLFLLRPDADDVFYVNRATWVANYGTAATNDTMFGPNTLPPANDGGLLTPSIEALQGVMAHTLGIQAATVCYLLAVPVLGAMVGWITWRLIRAVAPRRHLLAMAVSMLFLLASADSIIGNYSLGRIWQGKAAAYSILIPLAWLLLIRTVDRARRADVAMLLVAGIAFVGLTTSSALLAPVIAASALVAALLMRSKSLALGALAFLIAPLINGLAQAFGPAVIGAGDTSVMETQKAFGLAFGIDLPMILLALVALMLIPRIVPGRPGVLLGCGALATMVALVPGVFELVNVATGAGPVAWRLLITMPLWILVGVLVSLPASPPSAERSLNGIRAQLTSRAGALSGAMVAVLIVVPLAYGTLLWKVEGASLTSRPTWKVNQEALSDVRAARALDGPQGLWLLPPEQMKVLSISTVGPFSVVPRHFYLAGLDVSAQNRADRMTLFNLYTNWEPVEVLEVRGALDRLGVSFACVEYDAGRGNRILRKAMQEKLKPVGQMNCGAR